MKEMIKKELNALVDTEYKARLLQDYPAEGRPVIGVPFNRLREFSLEFVGRKDWREIVDKQLSEETFEEMVLQALIIGVAKNKIRETLAWFAEYLQKIDTCQLCDASCLAFHPAVEYPEETLDFIRPYLESPEGFEQRFAIVTLLDHFITLDAIDQTLALFADIRPATRYAQEALAWGYEVCFLTFQQKTIYALRKSNLSYNYFNSILDRIQKSPRISESQRKIVGELRR